MAGPVSVALVSFPEQLLPKIITGELLPGLNDSKKLSEKKRESLLPEILELAERVAHCFVSPRFIDLYGINPATLRGILTCIHKANANSSHLIMDGKDVYRSTELQKSRIRFLIQGDSRVASIAAASIVAKVRRDQLMKAYHGRYPDYYFAKHKGYGTELHREIISRLGPVKIHRRSYLGLKREN